MATLSFDYSELAATVNVTGSPDMSPDIRHAAADSAVSEQRTWQVTVTATPDTQTPIVLSKVGDADWLTVPETCESGTPFVVTVDASGLMPSTEPYRETIRATLAEYETADVPISLLVLPTSKAAS